MLSSFTVMEDIQFDLWGSSHVIYLWYSDVLGTDLTN